MKIIVVAGGGRNVGKTTVSEELGRLLDAIVVKMGSHRSKPEKNELFFENHTSFEQLAKALDLRDSSKGYLIIESGSILNDPLFKPDLVIFMPRTDGGPDKEVSHARRKRADLVSTESISSGLKSQLAKRLELDQETFDRLLEIVNV